MATATTSVAPDNSTDANFRAWGSWISARLSAFGWVQTTDTGQINWSTVTHPTTTNTAQGFEIWKMGDTLQATAPVFLKIEYASGAAATYPSLFVTLGQASDGAGNLTGITTTRKQLAPSSSGNSTNLCLCVASGDVNRFQLGMFVNANTAVPTTSIGWLLSVERTKDATGADTSAGVNIIGMSTSGFIQQLLPLGAGSPPTAETSILSVGTINTSAVYGANVGIGVIWPFLGQYLNPLLDTLTYIIGDSTQGATMVVPMYGSNHTYYCLGATSYVAFEGGQRGNSTLTSLMMRYE